MPQVQQHSGRRGNVLPKLRSQTRLTDEYQGIATQELMGTDCHRFLSASWSERPGFPFG